MRFILVMAETTSIEPLALGALKLALTYVMRTANHIDRIKPCIKNLMLW